MEEPVIQGVSSLGRATSRLKWMSWPKWGGDAWVRKSHGKDPELSFHHHLSSKVHKCESASEKMPRAGAFHLCSSLSHPCPKRQERHRECRRGETLPTANDSQTVTKTRAQVHVQLGETLGTTVVPWGMARSRFVF